MLSTVFYVFVNNITIFIFIRSFWSIIMTIYHKASDEVAKEPSKLAVKMMKI